MGLIYARQMSVYDFYNGIIACRCLFAQSVLFESYQKVWCTLTVRKTNGWRPSYNDDEPQADEEQNPLTSVFGISYRPFKILLK